MTPEREHSLLVDPAKCIGCVACGRACPTQAIRVRDGLAVVKGELCTDCGACIPACPHDAMRARLSAPAELQKFAYTVAIPSLTLYGQFGRDLHPSQVLYALTRLGFHDTYDMSWMCEMVAQATDALLSESRGPWPLISVTCPAIVRLVQIRYPELLPHLVPIESPRELAAKLLRRRLVAEHGLAPEEIGIFFITPCTAIMNSIIAPVGLEQSYFDGAFAINELYAPLLQEIRRSGPANGASHRDDQFSPSGLLWAMAGGELGGMRNRNTMTVRGLQDVLFVFDHIESGRFQSVDFIEIYMCPDGCVSGGLTLEGRYAAQRNIQQVVRRLGKQSPVKEEKVRSLLREHFFDLEEQIRSREIRPLAQDLRQAIALKRERSELLAKLPRKDCGACGAPDCAAHADDVLRGEAAVEDCVFLKLARAEELLRAREEGRT
jgi:iron only hydrogenase large subunit-like protein